VERGMTDTARFERIMLVDDERVDQLMYQRVLNRIGIARDIVAFSGAPAALDYLDGPGHPQVDLILLDINMPRMNGFEFLDACRHITRPAFDPMVLIMLTNDLTTHDHTRATGFRQVKGLLLKPLRADAFLEAVTRSAPQRQVAVE
jgi:CheY-like chemotaxis protein